MSMEPAKSIITKLGGIDATASVTGAHKSRVYRWMASKDAGGTGGLIPQRHIPAILRHAERVGIDMNPAEFFEAPQSNTASYASPAGPEYPAFDPDAPPASAATAPPDDARSLGVPADKTLLSAPRGLPALEDHT